MSRITRYRSLAFAGIAAAILASTGCDDMTKSQATMKQQQYNRWNTARIGVMLQLAQQQYEVGDYDKCRKTLDEAFAMKARRSSALHVLAAKVEIEKGSLEAAADHLQTAARIDPNSPEPFYLLGVVYQRWQKNDVAADYYQQAWDRKPGDAMYMMAVAEMKISLGKLDDAKKILQDKEVYFEQSAAPDCTARIASMQNDHATACKYYRDAVILLPEDQKVRRSYAEELYSAEKYADAASIFEDMKKDAKGAEKEGLELLLAECDLKIRRPFDARSNLQEVVRENPNDTAAYLLLAETCVETGDTSIAALASAHKALAAGAGQRAGDDCGCGDSAAAAELGGFTGDAGEGIEAVAGEFDGAVHDRAGAEELGKKEEAVAFYQKAADANPKDTWAGELLEKAKGTAAGTSSNAGKAAEPVAAAPVQLKPAVAAAVEETPVAAAESAEEKPVPTATSVEEKPASSGGERVGGRVERPTNERAKKGGTGDFVRAWEDRRIAR